MENNTRKILSTFTFKDMQCNYLIDDDRYVTLELIPLGMDQDIVREKKILHPDSLIHAKLVGDAYPANNANGLSMRQSQTTELMRYQKQECIKKDASTTIRTFLTDERGYLYIHELGYTENDYALSSRVIFENHSPEPITLEYITSFSLGNITPFLPEEGANGLNVYRIRSKWSNEAHLVKETATSLQLENTWSNWHPLSVRYGQRGSMPVKEYSPFGAVEDQVNHVIWGAMLAIECSWDMEFYRRDHALCFSGGLADREFGHWMKTIAPAESFTTPTAILSVCRGDIDYLCQRLTHFGEKFINKKHVTEESLPVLFNEYCTTWGLPSHENIMNTVNAIQGHGVEYFVIDCGWYVEEGRPWYDGMGDYVPSPILFPKGIKYTIDCIREAGFKPGIWYEIDNVGKEARIYEQDDMFLHRDGQVLTTLNRKFFNMADPKVQAYLDEKVINQIREFGIEYVKMDYNDTIGLGCDGAESLGEGLRIDREASVNYVRHMKEELPDLLLENCASGGHKLEPLMMSLCDMASFSDAHECENIPLIAAGLHRTILPRQSQIWAVIRETDSLQRIAYTLTNTFLGRMCFSGDVTKLSGEQWKQIDDGIAFYKEIAPIIKNGYSYIHRHTGESDNCLTGYQAVVRLKNENKEASLIPSESTEAMVVVHIFHEYPETITVELPKGCPSTIANLYRGTEISVSVQGQTLTITPSQSMEAIGIHLVNRNA